jgi:3-hydroxyacyl-CoA dehydrogenase
MLIHSPEERYSLNGVAVPVRSDEGLDAESRFAAEANERLRALVAWKWHCVDRMLSDPPPAIRSVGIIGAGTMGRAIAAEHCRCRLPVVLTDRSADALATADRYFPEQLDKNQWEAASTDFWFRTTTHVTDLACCDLVLETIPEIATAKRELYRGVENVLCGEAVLATNTSTIPLSRLTGGLQRPDRFCGMHFFHPVRERPLIEIIRGARTSEATLSRAVAHARRLGMLPIIIPDGPGFIINRLLFPYLAEAMELVCEGAEFKEVENAAEDFGMAKGPFRLMDEIGLDTVLQGGWVLSAAFSERIPHSPLLVAMVKAGRTGCKAGRGFWDYDGQESDLQPAVPGRLVDGPRGTGPICETAMQAGCPSSGRSAANRSCLLPTAVRSLAAAWVRVRRTFCREDLQARLLLAMLLEAFRILEEGLVSDYRDIELGVLFGLGFPPERGGLFSWAEEMGAPRIGELLQPWIDLGPRFQPPPIMQDWLSQGRRLFSRRLAPPLSLEYPPAIDSHGWTCLP